MNEKCNVCIVLAYAPKGEALILEIKCFYQEQIKQYDNKIRDMIKFNRNLFMGIKKNGKW